MSISNPPFQAILVDADGRTQTPWVQWFSQLQPLLNSVNSSGPTSARPTSGLYIGYAYFDTTINQMIYWNGATWVVNAPSTSGTSILKGNGTGGFNNAISGIDFAPATTGTTILFGNNAGGFNSVAIGTGVTFVGGVLSATGTGGTVTAVTGISPILSSGGITPAISIPVATTLVSGYLSSTDWTTFNNKGTVSSVVGTGSVNGITLTGTVTSSGSLTLGGTLGSIANSQLTNSSITINGTATSLGGSATVTATATNALTIGTGLSGTSYNGSTAVTIANAGVLSIAGTANQVIASASTGAVTLSLPQSINSGATPTFTGTNFTGIPNAGLTNSAITINGTHTSLGGSISVGTVTGVTGTAPVVSSGGTAPAISMAAATTSVNGYLTSTDWNTFNNKSNSNGTVTSVAAITLGTTGTDLSSTVATGTTTPVITLQVPTASAANRGALSAANWSTFNSKQTALVSGTNIKTVGGVSLLGSGDVGTIGTGYGGTGLSTFTANSIFYASSTSVMAQSAGLTFDGSNFATTGNINGVMIAASGSLSWGSGGTYAAGCIYADANWGAIFRAKTASPLIALFMWANSANTEFMRMAPTGGINIGGTTDPGAGNLSVAGTVKTQGYTVATLPAGVTGARAYVTNALAPVFGSTVVTGGAVTIPVFYNGTNWIVG